jgi:hypothetical protein
VARKIKNPKKPSPRLKIKTKVDLPLPPAVPSASSLTGPVWGIIFGWAAVAFFMLALQHFHPIYMPSYMTFSPPEWHHLLALLAAGLMLLAWSFRSAPPDSPASGDFSRPVAWAWLALILVLAAAMRLFEANQIPSNYWDDLCLPLTEACQISEYNHWCGQDEPLHPCALASFLYLFPQWSGLYIQRITAVVFDLTAIWLFYLLGKEFGKRRIGIFMASFGAICKAQIILDLSYMRFCTIPVTVAAVLLFSLRLFKKPTLTHYLQWTFFVTLGYYTYTSYRPLGPFFIVAVLGWILLREKRKPFPYWHYGLGLGLILLVGLLFTYQNRFILAPGSPLRAAATLVMENKWLVGLWGLALLMAWIKIWRDSRKGKTDQGMVYWALGVVLIVLLAMPILDVSYLSTRMSNISVLSVSAPHSLAATLHTLTQRVWLTVQTLFFSGSDRSDLNLFYDPFFGVIDCIVIVPGLLFILAQPTWPRVFILLAGLVGVIPHIVADPGGSRLTDCITPFLLAGALGLNRMVEVGAASAHSKIWKGVFLAIWVGLVGVGATVTFQKLYFHFMRQDGPTVAYARQITLDCGDNRVYLSVFEGFLAEQILNENNTVYQFSALSNPIDLGAGEPKPNVVLLLKTDRIPTPGLLALLKAQYPGAQWQTNPVHPPYIGGTDQMIRVFIPADQIPEGGSALFHVVRVPSNHWTRRIYTASYRLGKGVILDEDKANSLTDPFQFATGNYGVCTARFETAFNATTEGRYRFLVDTDQPLNLWVDGRNILKLRPFGKGHFTGSLHLTAGNHPLTFMCFSPVTLGIPRFTVQYPDGQTQPLR